MAVAKRNERQPTPCPWVRPTPTISFCHEFVMQSLTRPPAKTHWCLKQHGVISKRGGLGRRCTASFVMCTFGAAREQATTGKCTTDYTDGMHTALHNRNGTMRKERWRRSRHARDHRVLTSALRHSTVVSPVRCAGGNNSIDREPTPPPSPPPNQPTNTWNKTIRWCEHECKKRSMFNRDQKHREARIAGHTGRCNRASRAIPFPWRDQSLLHAGCQ